MTGSIRALIDRVKFGKSKAALDAYDADPTHSEFRADYAEAVLGTGDNAHGSTNPDDYDDEGRLRRRSAVTSSRA